MRSPLKRSRSISSVSFARCAAYRRSARATCISLPCSCLSAAFNQAAISSSDHATSREGFSEMLISRAQFCVACNVKIATWNRFERTAFAFR